MMRTQTTLAAAALVAAGALAIPAESTQAKELEVQLTGLDLFFGFDGGSNVQSGPTAGDVDQVQSATFYVDGVSLGTLVGDISASFGLPGFFIDADGGTAKNQFELGFVNFDFDTTDGSSGFLDLGFNSAFTAEIYYTGNEIGLSLFGSSDEIRSQQSIDRLPAWDGFDDFETIRLSFVSTNLSDVETENGLLSQFRASGSGTLDGVGDVVPEPTTAAVLGLGAVGLLARRRRR